MGGVAAGHQKCEPLSVYVHAAIRTAVKIGKGKGPVNHLAKVEGSDVQSPTSQTDRKKGRAR